MKQIKKRTVEDFMTTTVISAKHTDTLDGVAVAMNTANIRHVVVADARSRVIGIISDRDVLHALAFANGKCIPVCEVMSPNVSTVHVDTLAHKAVQIMLDEKVSALPVLGDDGQLVGIVTATDFLVVARQALAGSPIGRIVAQL